MFRVSTVLLVTTTFACTTDVSPPPTGCARGAVAGAEGEGEGEGEGVAIGGEGEGAAIGGEGEGGALVGEGEGAVAGEGEGEGTSSPPQQPQPGFGVPSGGDPNVTWNVGCWQLDVGQNFQAMDFHLQTSTPVPLEGTLFFNTRCDPVDGTDNLNDFGTTTGSGSWLYWFIHHHDERQTSAIWWIGDVQSPCVDYSVAPDCG